LADEVKRLETEVKRLDELRSADAKRLDELRSADAKRLDELRTSDKEQMRLQARVGDEKKHRQFLENLVDFKFHGDYRLLREKLEKNHTTATEPARDELPKTPSSQ
jgi:hypothetical protein